MCMQIASALTQHIKLISTTSTVTNRGHQLALCSYHPADFRANLREHVATMAPLGFNAHALGVLAARHLSLFLGTPQALAAQYTMLRSVFHPWSDELADSVGKSIITPACLPAVVPDSEAACAMRQYGPTPGKAPISQLHKAVLAGPVSLLVCMRDGLQRRTRMLVAAGLYATEADAARACMQRTPLLLSRKLEWYLERKVAVMEGGGTLDDVRTACCCTQSLQAALPCLLLWQRARCAPSMSVKHMQRSTPPECCACRMPWHPVPTWQASSCSRVQGSFPHQQRFQAPCEADW